MNHTGGNGTEEHPGGNRNGNHAGGNGNGNPTCLGWPAFPGRGQETDMDVGSEGKVRITNRSWNWNHMGGIGNGNPIGSG